MENEYPEIIFQPTKSTAKFFKLTLTVGSNSEIIDMNLIGRKMIGNDEQDGFVNVRFLKKNKRMYKRESQEVGHSDTIIDPIKLTSEDQLRGIQKVLDLLVMYKDVVSEIHIKSNSLNQEYKGWGIGEGRARVTDIIHNHLQIKPTGIIIQAKKPAKEVYIRKYELHDMD